MTKSKRVLVVCDNYEQVVQSFNNVLDIYKDTQLITSFNRKKRKIFMYPNYVWHFKEQSAVNETLNYYRTYTYNDISEAVTRFSSHDLQ